MLNDLKPHGRQIKDLKMLGERLGKLVIKCLDYEQLWDNEVNDDFSCNSEDSEQLLSAFIKGEETTTYRWKSLHRDSDGDEEEK